MDQPFPKHKAAKVARKYSKTQGRYAGLADDHTETGRDEAPQLRSTITGPQDRDLAPAALVFAFSDGGPHNRGVGHARAGAIRRDCVSRLNKRD